MTDEIMEIKIELATLRALTEQALKAYPVAKVAEKTADKALEMAQEALVVLSRAVPVPAPSLKEMDRVVSELPNDSDLDEIFNSLP